MNIFFIVGHWSKKRCKGTEKSSFVQASVTFFQKKHNILHFLSEKFAYVKKKQYFCSRF